MALAKYDMVAANAEMYGQGNVLTVVVEDNNASFTEMVHAYFSKLLPIAFGITKDQHAAEDIVQEAFLKLWQKRQEIIPDNIGGWLYTVVTNAAYKHIKNEARKMQALRFLPKDKYSNYTEAEDQLMHKETVVVYDKLCMRLPKKQQIVYRLSQQEELSRKEIAIQLNISPNTVKVHLLRAAQFIKEHMVSACLFVFFFTMSTVFSGNGNTNKNKKELPEVIHYYKARFTFLPGGGYSVSKEADYNIFTAVK